LTNFSKPDIVYIIGRLEKYIHYPNHSHWTVLKNVFKYLN